MANMPGAKFFWIMKRNDEKRLVSLYTRCEVAYASRHTLDEKERYNETNIHCKTDDFLKRTVVRQAGQLFLPVCNHSSTQA